MICKQCNIEFFEKYSKWSDGNFCSKKCASTFSSKQRTEDDFKRVSNKLIKTGKYVKKLCTCCGKRNFSQKSDLCRKCKPKQNRNTYGIHVISWRQRTKIKLVEYKGGKCEKCGYSRCIASLGFHHRNPEMKDFRISGSCRSFERLKIEVDKCDLLCANCHNELHWELKFGGIGQRGEPGRP